MTRSLAAILVGTIIVGIQGPVPVRAGDQTDFTGRWALNRELSQFPREIGFGVDWLSQAGSGKESNTSGGGGRGRRGSGGGGAGGAGAFATRPESADDAKRLLQLTAEVRKPSTYLTIVETQTAVTITDDRGQSRAFHPDSKREMLQLDGVAVGVTAKREAGRLVVVYNVEQDRELRYSYSRTASPPQLVVEVQFVERGGGDRVRRVYEPASVAPSTTETTSPDRLPAQTIDQQPDAELKGLTKLGIVVEGLSPQAAACGLNQAALEKAVSTHLSSAGFKVLLNSDEDTYIYVNVITSSLSNGLCVSRYDTFLYTHTTAKLSYHETPVLVQVSLLHKGGIAGGAPAAHAEGVLRGVQEYVDQFSTRIRDANK